MKVALTGHTSGIGKSIVDMLEARGHTVIGYSRTTGHDLCEPGLVGRLVSAIVDLDVFVNSAYSANCGMIQVDLLYAMFDVWKNNPAKTIVCISSTAPDGIASYRHEYAIHKTALDKACEQLVRLARCRIINIRPQFVDTPMTSWKTTGAKMSPDDVADAVCWALQQPKHVLVSSITLRNGPR